MRAIARKTKRAFVIWRSLQRIEKILVLKLAYWLVFGKIAGRVLPFRVFAKMLGVQGKTQNVEPPESDVLLLKNISSVLSRLARRLPGKYTCLMEAFAAARVLKSYGVSYIIYFGVNRDKNNNLNAHAWLQCGSFEMTGCGIKDEFNIINVFVG